MQLGKIFKFYSDGFRGMKLGRTLWAVILIKLFIIFVLLKFFIFDENLNSKFKTDQEKIDFIYKNLTKE
ncbi:MAG: DUF4492 domain-containing protein [Campylobacter sp.]|nr:DUF4492 domain-containing protein [Campylobacter sp.]